MKITLSWYELWIAGSIGLKRHIEALQKGLADKHGFNGDGWGAHVEGAAGEMAAAKAMNRYYSGSINTFREGDVGKLQVRTRSKDGYELIVRQNDRDDDYFVLVVGKCPEFTVVGWIRAREAKNPQWLREHGGREAAYFVPQGMLEPIETISQGLSVS